MIAALNITERDAVADAFNDLRGLVVKTARRFANKHGLDADTAIADANTHFVRAYQTHETRGHGMTFERWVYYCVHFGLTDELKKSARRHHKTPVVPLGDNAETLAASDCGPGRLHEMLEALPPDAALVARLTLEAPAELAAAAEAKGGTACNFRSTLRSHLRGLGWTACRINEAFEEIRAAIQG